MCLRKIVWNRIWINQDLNVPKEKTFDVHSLRTQYRRMETYKGLLLLVDLYLRVLSADLNSKAWPLLRRINPIQSISMLEGYRSTGCLQGRFLLYRLSNNNVFRKPTFECYTSCHGTWYWQWVVPAIRSSGCRHSLIWFWWWGQSGLPEKQL
jgi:hypothetical protein